METEVIDKLLTGLYVVANVGSKFYENKKSTKVQNDLKIMCKRIEDLERDNHT